MSIDRTLIRSIHSARTGLFNAFLAFLYLGLFLLPTLYGVKGAEARTATKAQRQVATAERPWEGIIEKKWGISLSTHFVNFSEKIKRDYQKNEFNVPDSNGLSWGISFLYRRQGDLASLGFFTNFFSLPREVKSSAQSHREATFNAMTLGPALQYRFTEGEDYELFGSLAWGLGFSKMKIDGIDSNYNKVESELKQKFYQLEPGFGVDFNRLYRVGISMKLAYPMIFVFSNKRSGHIYSESSKIMETLKMDLNFYIKSSKCRGSCSSLADYSSGKSPIPFMEGGSENPYLKKGGINYSKKNKASDSFSHSKRERNDTDDTDDTEAR